MAPPFHLSEGSRAAGGRGLEGQRVRSGRRDGIAADDPEKTGKRKAES